MTRGGTGRWGTGQSCAPEEQTVISSVARGQARPVWAILHYHCARRLRLNVPYLSRMASFVAPEGGGGDYGSARAATTSWASAR